MSKTKDPTTSRLTIARDPGESFTIGPITCRYDRIEHGFASVWTEDAETGAKYSQAIRLWQTIGLRSDLVLKLTDLGPKKATFQIICPRDRVKVYPVARIEEKATK